MTFIAFLKVIVSCVCCLFAVPAFFWLLRKMDEIDNLSLPLLLILSFLATSLLFGLIACGVVLGLQYHNERVLGLFIMLGFVVAMPKRENNKR